MAQLSATDWIAVFSIAAPLIAKSISDWQANAVVKHNALLDRIIGMAGREAATINTALVSGGPNVSPKALEKELISGSVQSILQEMGSSSASIGANSDKITAIVQGELDKLTTPRPVIAVPSEPATARPSDVPT